MSPAFSKRRVAIAVLVAVIITLCNTIYLHFKHQAAALESRHRGMPFGFVDEILEDTPEPNKVTVHGWALGKAGIASVEVVVNGEHRFPVPTRFPRVDVGRMYSDFPDARRAGFRGTVDLAEAGATDPIRVIDVVATDIHGAASSLKHVVRIPGADEYGQGEPRRARSPVRKDVFYIVMATSNIDKGGAADIETVFRPYESRTIKVGVRLPILYMRSTKGAQENYAFDPDFPLTRECGGRPVIGDNLSGVIAYSIAHRLPVLFTLNGGIWADAACDDAQWDANDALERDVDNCQWNNNDQVMSDGYLKDLTGSFASPELGRALTLNVYAQDNRRYKKRNLQQAASLIKRFATEHPDLFIGVNLDPDNYVNPFFEGSQWYDFNPGTLRQFREWLQGSGPYAGPTKPGVPDLSAYRRKRTLTLEEINSLSGQDFKRWDEVTPPRVMDIKLTRRPFWEDSWFAEWEHFRRHLVALHYDELSEWVVATGIGAEFVYTAQGFMPPGKYIQPFPIAINSPAKNYDTGGMSIEGSVPSRGHLGAILYGGSAVNNVRMETRQSLFSVFRKLDPGWAVVEFNTADLTNPARLPDFSEGYRSLREIYNHGARFVSPMAWNGSRGTAVGQPGFAAHMALRESPLEHAIKDFMRTHADLPVGSRLWTFGSGTHADLDGWQAGKQTRITSAPGLLTLGSGSGTPGLRRIGEGPLSGDDMSCWSRCLGSVMSPGDLAFRPDEFEAIEVKVAAIRDVEWVGVEGQTKEGKWIPLAAPVRGDAVGTDEGTLKFELLPAATEYHRIRLTWRTTAGSSVRLQRVAFVARQGYDARLVARVGSPARLRSGTL